MWVCLFWGHPFVRTFKGTTKERPGPSWARRLKKEDAPMLGFVCPWDEKKSGVGARVSFPGHGGLAGVGSWGLGIARVPDATRRVARLAAVGMRLAPEGSKLGSGLFLFQGWWGGFLENGLLLRISTWLGSSNMKGLRLPPDVPSSKKKYSTPCWVSSNYLPSKLPQSPD